MIVNLGCIVEGHGEVEAVPVLLRRIQQEFNPNLGLDVPRPIRIRRNKLVQRGELKCDSNELDRAVELTARRLQQPGAILILIDAEDDCPATLGPALLQRARQIRSNINIGVVLAKTEFEGWFLAALESLQGRRGLAESLAEVQNPESVQNAKRRLTLSMSGSRVYSETVDQPALAARFDMEQARRRSDSFDKCYREVTRLLESPLRTP